jgi:outer membrane protein assembly factor BamA
VRSVLPTCPLVLGAALVAGACAVAGCHGGIAPRPPLAPTCRPDRIGAVTVTGAAPAEVAPLAVLEGTLDDPERTARTIEVATDLLHTQGYPRATVAVARHEGCGVELAVAVDRGPHYSIASIDVAADVTARGALPAGDPRTALEDGLGSVNAVGGAYVEDRLIRALASLVDRYRAAGWLDAIAGAPAARWNDASHTVRLSVQLHPGRRYRIGTVSGRPAVIAALGLRGGEWFDADTLKIALARARRQLARRLAVRVSVAAARAAIDLEIK